MIRFLHGTITFRKDEDVPPGWGYTLEGTFPDGIGANVPIVALDKLQRRCRGTLDIERLDDNGMRIKKSIVAHGAESARKQAYDLRSLLLLFLGFRTNVAHPLLS